MKAIVILCICYRVVWISSAAMWSVLYLISRPCQLHELPSTFTFSYGYCFCCLPQQLYCRKAAFCCPINFYILMNGSLKICSQISVWMYSMVFLSYWFSYSKADLFEIHQAFTDLLARLSNSAKDSVSIF